MQRYLIFVQKEFFHILRDKRTILILLLLPVIQIILFGFALSTEIRNANITVVDFAKDNLSAELTGKLAASAYFTVTPAGSVQEGEKYIQRGDADLMLVIDRDLKKGIVTGKPEIALQLVADASDPNKARLVANYAAAIAGSSEILRDLSRIAGENRNNAPSAGNIRITERMLYNPAMKGAYNFVPGVMGLILMLICSMMTSLSIVKEKERGTMDLIYVSPVKPLAVVTAKMIPYLALSLVNLITILLLSNFVLEVPIRGSLFLLSVLSVIFILVSLSIGLLISTLVSSQMAALVGSGMVLMMPTVVLSGMMFPIESMPLFLQVISTIIPARWYIEGVREVMIQGLGLGYIAKELFILTGMATVLLVVSIRKFKSRA